MGEKLLTQRLIVALRETDGAASRTAHALLGWAADNRDWLWPAAEAGASGEKAKKRKRGGKIGWDRLPALARRIDTDEPVSPLETSLAGVSSMLGFDPFEAALLSAVASLQRLPRLSSLRARLTSAGADMLPLIGLIAGAGTADAAARVRRAAPVALGLIRIEMARSGGFTLDLDWRFENLLDCGAAGEDRIVEALVGLPQRPALEPDDFAEHTQSLDLLARLLSGALERKAPGVNILIHGPPGTGKTEFARTLAASAGAALYAVGEADADGEEPTRWERIHALKRAQRLLGRRSDSLLLFDEMEDLFAAASDNQSERRAGSKIFVNRLLEDNGVPTLWTSNDIAAIDPAHLRRMSFVLRMDHPSARARTRIAARAAADEGAVEAAAGLAPLLAREAESASVARVALRCAALAGGGADEAGRAAASLLLAMRGGRALPPAPEGGGLDLSLYEADLEIAPLVERLAAPGSPRDFSLLLTGPPGTGKTALAAHLAERLDRPLRVKRASDLLSKWVGGTEAKIADAFAEAREDGAVLLFDEADSLLLDRADAQRSWEITQVNELLTWMDAHPLPFVAATNFARRLDPAALRRFVFKIELRSMSEETAGRAFQRFFGLPAPAALGEVAGLTAGDFAVVKRQLRHRPAADTAQVVELLAAEMRAKPERSVRIGF
ncbi:MAG TPA: AAA family ATPase [Allosphingosinicella sp.]|jgi:SpoVK/Ycf46/Vps4 family AAA+-type ATPase